LQDATVGQWELSEYVRSKASIKQKAELAESPRRRADGQPFGSQLYLVAYPYPKVLRSL
jgi:hypothetical protein